jgi:vesicle coat complex subunit
MNLSTDEQYIYNNYDAKLQPKTESNDEIVRRREMNDLYSRLEFELTQFLGQTKTRKQIFQILTELIEYIEAEKQKYL